MPTTQCTDLDVQSEPKNVDSPRTGLSSLFTAKGNEAYPANDRSFVRDESSGFVDVRRVPYHASIAQKTVRQELQGRGQAVPNLGQADDCIGSNQDPV